MEDLILKLETELAELSDKAFDLTRQYDPIQERIRAYEISMSVAGKHPFLEDLKHNDRKRIQLRSKLLYHSSRVFQYFLVDNEYYTRYGCTRSNERRFYGQIDQDKQYILKRIEFYLQRLNISSDFKSEGYRKKIIEKLKLLSMFNVNSLKSISELKSDIYNDYQFEIIVRACSNILIFGSSKYDAKINDYGVEDGVQISGWLGIIIILTVPVVLTIPVYFLLATIASYRPAALFGSFVIYSAIMLGLIYLNMWYDSYQTESATCKLHKKIYGLTSKKLLGEIQLFIHDIKEFKENSVSHDIRIKEEVKRLESIQGPIYKELSSTREAIRKIEGEISSLKSELRSEKNLQIYRKKRAEKEELLKKQSYWLKLNGHEFEKEIAFLLNRIGYKAYTTLGSNDKGIDVYLRFKDIEIPIQCKNHSRPVSPGAIRDFQGAISVIPNVTKSIFISSKGFTPGAKKTAFMTDILLLDANDVVQLNEGNKYKINQIREYLK